MAGAHPPGHLISVQFRHQYVQNQQIIDTQLGIFQPGLPIQGDICLKPFFPQQFPDGIRQKFLVFYDQNLHALTSLFHYIVTLFAELKLKGIFAFFHLLRVFKAQKSARNSPLQGSARFCT